MWFTNVGAGNGVTCTGVATGRVAYGHGAGCRMVRSKADLVRMPPKCSCILDQWSGDAFGSACDLKLGSGLGE